jgi:hypothetical protein
MALRRVLRPLVPSLLAAAALLALPASASALPAPVAAGTSAANIALTGHDKWTVMRWVARSTGTLSALHMRIQADGSVCRLNGRTGYGGGNGGDWTVTTHPVRADGSPDTSRTLASQKFRPCGGPLEIVNVVEGVVRLRMGIGVVRGTEYATVIRNTDPLPAQNYSSPNFLYTSTGLVGANARNERSASAPDAHYGLDPRELVGYSRDGGQTWSLPGGPYGLPGGRNFLPTYLQEFEGGRITGQPYYYAPATTGGSRTMTFQNIKRDWTIQELGAFTAKPGEGTLTLTVDGVRRAVANVTGPGMLRARIDPVTVRPGQTVKVTASGLSIQPIVADTAWGRLMGFYLPSTPWTADGGSSWSSAAPVYALPAYHDVEYRIVNGEQPGATTKKAKKAKKSRKSKRKRAARKRKARRGARRR